MNAKAVAAWSAACLFIVLFTSNPIYKGLILAAALAALAAGAGFRRMKRLLAGVAVVASLDVLLNFVSAHVGTTILFQLPDAIPAFGGRYTLEAFAYGVSGGLTIAAAIAVAAPFSLLLGAHDVVDALPAALSRTGTTLAASVSLVPAISRSFVEVSEAQRLRGWRPRGPRSWAEVVVPVVLTSVESSIQLAESMEARGFGTGARTSFGSPALQGSGWALIAASAIALGLFGLARVTGISAEWMPYPTLSLPSVDLLSLAACGFLFAPGVTWRSRA